MLKDGLYEQVINRNVKVNSDGSFVLTHRNIEALFQTEI